MEESREKAGGAAVMQAPVPQADTSVQPGKDADKGSAAAQPEKKAAEAAVQPEQKAEGADGQKKAGAQQAGEGSKQEQAPRPNMHRRTVIYTLVVMLYALVAKVLFFVRIEGREQIPKDRNCVLMGNHQCLLDPLMLALCVPDREIHFMGKKELFENPVLGWVFRKVHGFPVDRGNIDMGAIRTAMGVLKNGDTLGIFPEGTRSRSGHMLPLLGGASMLALRSGCDVIPIYIDGRYRLFHRMVVRVGRPIETADLRAGRINKEACDVLTHRMEGAFAHLSGGKSLPPA